MATIPTDRHTDIAGGFSIETALRCIEEKLAGATTPRDESAFFAGMQESLRRLHAQLRIHHAEGFRRGAIDATVDTPPELVEMLHRLKNERPQILGDLDRLIRGSEFMADASLEDRDVYVLRVRELVALLRRHQAEEDRLFFLAVWRDTGGES